MVNSNRNSYLKAEAKKNLLIKKLIILAIAITLVLLIIVFGAYFKITGYVTSSVNLAKSSYSPSEALIGDTSITLYTYDLVPQGTTVCLQIWETGAYSSTLYDFNCNSLSNYLSNSNDSSCYFLRPGYFNDESADRGWEGTIGYGFYPDYGGCPGNRTFTVPASFFNLNAPSSSGDYVLRLNATYDPTNETVMQSDDYSFAVSLYQITSCTNITASGIYLLSQNISGNQSNGRCIDIQANDTVLDCQGYWISGSDVRKRKNKYYCEKLQSAGL